MLQKNMGDTIFDKQFKGIKLTWLPWVGNDYSNLPGNCKLLLVGESNYGGWEGDNDDDGLKDTGFTRWIINHDGIDHNSNNGDPEYFHRRIMRNTEMAFYNNSEPTTEQKRKLWLSVGYYNIVQRAMESISERPNDKDYSIGWDTFFKVIEILKPNYCLFCGVEAANYFSAFEKNSFNTDGIHYLAKVSNTYPRIATVISKDKHATKLIFMKHPSKYFLWESWAEFIEQQMGDYTTWLRKN